jgi:hypothetical protein
MGHFPSKATKRCGKPTMNVNHFPKGLPMIFL